MLAERSQTLFFGSAPLCPVTTSYSTLGSWSTAPGARSGVMDIKPTPAAHVGAAGYQTAGAVVPPFVSTFDEAPAAP